MRGQLESHLMYDKSVSHTSSVLPEFHQDRIQMLRTLDTSPGLQRVWQLRQRTGLSGGDGQELRYKLLSTMTEVSRKPDPDRT